MIFKFRNSFYYKMTRLLTNDEIKYVIKKVNAEILQRKSDDVENVIISNINDGLIEQLKNIKLYPSKLDKLIEKIIESAVKSRLHPGEMLGVSAATSIAKPTTQTVLSSFHYAGVMNITKTFGLPLFLELINVAHNPKNPSMTIYYKTNYEVEMNVNENECTCDKFSGIVKFKGKYKNVKINNKYASISGIINCDKKMKNEEWKFGKNINIEFEKEEKDPIIKFIGFDYNIKYIKLIEYMTLEDITTSYKVVYDNEKKEEFYEIYEKIYGDEYKKFKWCIRFNINKQKILERLLDLKSICTKLEHLYKDVYCVHSPNHMGIIDVYVDIENVMSIDKILDDENMNLYINDDNKNYFFVTKVALPLLLGCQINGIKNVTKAVPRREPCKYNKNEMVYVLDTAGTNLKQVRCFEEFDHKYTVTNSLDEIYAIFGIEAAKHFLISQMMIALSSGEYIHHSHFEILASVMTFTGKINSISRFGVDKHQIGPLCRSTFEESVKTLETAAINGEKENTNGVSTSVVLGKMAKVGTGLCKLLINVDQLIES